jgi:hypothetical protein
METARGTVKALRTDDDEVHRARSPGVMPCLSTT